MTCWGTGAASREFLYVDDAAEGVLRTAETINEPLPINLGTGAEITIRVLAELIALHTGFRGGIHWDTGKPDGQPRRCLDTSRADQLLAWRAQIGLDDGLRRTVQWYRDRMESNRTQRVPVQQAA
jgi:GDP-L-fucose synthase